MSQAVQRVRGILTNLVLFQLAVDTITAAAKTEGGMMALSSWCGPMPPPPEVYRVEISVSAQMVSVKPLVPDDA